jgi:hypothetical protein
MCMGYSSRSARCKHLCWVLILNRVIIADEVTEGIQDTRLPFSVSPGHAYVCGSLHIHDGIFLCDVVILLVTGAMI